MPNVFGLTEAAELLYEACCVLALSLLSAGTRCVPSGSIVPLGGWVRAWE